MPTFWRVRDAGYCHRGGRLRFAVDLSCVQKTTVVAGDPRAAYTPGRAGPRLSRVTTRQRTGRRRRRCSSRARDRLESASPTSGRPEPVTWKLLPPGSSEAENSRSLRPFSWTQVTTEPRPPAPAPMRPRSRSPGRRRPAAIASHRPPRNRPRRQCPARASLQVDEASASVFGHRDTPSSRRSALGPSIVLAAETTAAPVDETEAGTSRTSAATSSAGVRAISIRLRRFARAAPAPVNALGTCG